MTTEFAQNRESRPFDFCVTELVVAGDKGPCGGVNMAIATTREILEIVAQREPVFANNPPVHNDLVAEEFKSLGLIIEPNLDNIPERAILILSAHGTQPSVVERLREKNLVVNTECQLVGRNRRNVQNAIQRGEIPLYFGVNGHPETQATIGDVKEQVIFVGSNSDLGEVEIPFGKKIRTVNQTTLSGRMVQGDADKLRDLNPDAQIEDPIGLCDATDNRQLAVESLFSDPQKPIDFLIVVGSPKSQNSQELRNIGSIFLGAERSRLINGPSDIDFSWFSKNIQRVGLTSGASVLDKYTDDVLKWFGSRGVIFTFLKGREKSLTFKKPEQDIEAIRQYIRQKYEN